MNWTRKHLGIAGLALIAATNAIALLGVAYNRSDEPESTLRLSERELRPPYISRDKYENSGLELKLRWRVLEQLPSEGGLYGWGYPGSGGSPAWLDRAKMAALGFDFTLPDVDREDSSAFGRQLPRDVLLVLELDGPIYQQSLERATKLAHAAGKDESDRGKRALKLLDEETRLNSRLFVVDAGLSLAALRTQYPNRSRYAIVAGQIRPAWRQGKLSMSHSGYVNALNIDAINVPLSLRAVFEGATPEDEPTGGSKERYEATVAIGKRLEPWITAAAKK